MDTFVNGLEGLINKFGGWLLQVLPSSPFQGWLGNFRSHFEPYLGYLNYFVPISDFLKIFSAFLTVYVLYLGYSIVLRWIKMIE